MIEAIDAFNTLPTDAKASPDAFLRFATVKGLAEDIGTQLDRYLAEERVLVPSRVGLDLIVEDEDRISFAPKIDGVEPDAMRQAFFALDYIDTIYTLDDPSGGRLRVVLDEQQREVLRRSKRSDCQNRTLAITPSDGIPCRHGYASLITSETLGTDFTGNPRPH